MKRFYGDLAKPVAKLSIDKPPRILTDPTGWQRDQSLRLAEQVAPITARMRTAETDRTARKAAEAQATKDRGRADRLAVELDKQKELAGRMRALPLTDVLDALGFSQDKHERTAGRPRASTSPLAPARRPENGSTMPQVLAVAAASTLSSTLPGPILRGPCRGLLIGSAPAPQPLT